MSSAYVRPPWRRGLILLLVVFVVRGAPGADATRGNTSASEVIKNHNYARARAGYVYGPDTHILIRSRWPERTHASVLSRVAALRVPSRSYPRNVNHTWHSRVRGM